MFRTSYAHKPELVRDSSLSGHRFIIYLQNLRTRYSSCNGTWYISPHALSDNWPSFDSLTALTALQLWKLWQLYSFDSLTALTALKLWQLDSFDSFTALTALQLWQLDSLTALTAWKLWQNFLPYNLWTVPNSRKPLKKLPTQNIHLLALLWSVQIGSFTLENL